MARFIYSAFSDEAAKDLAGQIAACKQNGITHMELRGIDGKNISDFSVEEARALKATLDANGMQVSSIGSHYGKIDITADFAPHFEAFQNTVAVAKILETAYIRMFSFYIPDGADAETYREEVLRRVTAMADYACENGILCCHENERGIYGDTPQRCLVLHEALGEKLGCILDPANYILCGQDPWQAYTLLGDYITYLHIKDAQIEQQRVVPAGEGDGSIAKILAALNENNKVYFLSVEPHLKVFAGLSDLEKDTAVQEHMDAFTYPDNAASFAAACGALRALVEQLQPLTLGVIGVGNMGTSHVRYFTEGKLRDFRLVAVADTNPQRLAEVRELLPEVQCFDSGMALIAAKPCDAVVIATPHYDHPPLVTAALENGIHALTEKPAGVYAKQVREMNEAAQKSDKVFAIMYNQRTNHLYRKLRELVQGGEYGELRRVNWLITDWYRTQAYYNSGGWRATWKGEGGGVLLNQCPHNLDLWQWICGMPSSVRAVCREGKWHDIEVEDDVTIYAEYPNGASGVFITSTGDCPGTNRLEITMDSGKFICENGELKIYKLEGKTSEHCANAETGFGRLKGEWITVETDGKNEQHTGVMNAFSAHLLHGTPLVARGEEGINGLTISNAAHLSYWTGQTVTLPIDEELFYSELQKKIANSTVTKEEAAVVAQDMADSFAK